MCHLSIFSKKDYISFIFLRIFEKIWVRDTKEAINKKMLFWKFFQIIMMSNCLLNFGIGKNSPTDKILNIRKNLVTKRFWWPLATLVCRDRASPWCPIGLSCGLSPLVKNYENLYWKVEKCEITKIAIRPKILNKWGWIFCAKSKEFNNIRKY